MVNWTPIDFQGIASMDQALVEQLDRYLDEKESQMSRTIIETIRQNDEEALLVIAPPPPKSQFKLSEAIEILNNEILSHKIRKISPKEDHWKSAVEKINQALWTYVEILENSVVELFIQLNQVGLEQWKPHLSKTVDAIKLSLLHRLESLEWGIRRLQRQLQTYKCINSKGEWFKQWFCSWHGLLDRSLIENVKKSQKFLKFQYKKFADRFTAYTALKNRVDQNLEKLSEYPVLNRLESDSVEKFKKIYELVKLWELNSSGRMFPNSEVVRSLSNFISPGRAIALFKEYYHALREKLFAQSRKIKSTPENIHHKALASDEITLLKMEDHTLGALIAKYRDFLLRTDPNPYVRSRWGFPEWIVGPEPLQAKELLTLGYDTEDLDTQFDVLKESINQGPTSFEEVNLSFAKHDIQHLIHEMGQPLSSASMARNQAEKIVSILSDLNELGSFHVEIVDFFREMLPKIMRVDWKFHVFFDIPHFSKLYHQHLGIVGPVEDRQHHNRLHRFRRHLQQILDWIKTRTSQKHTHEIEVDMSDIKGYLQDFLAQIQRFKQEESQNRESVINFVNVMTQELLEYRFLFGKFFHDLRLNNPEERRIRTQFLFVDQYFESAEVLLQDL